MPFRNSDSNNTTARHAAPFGGRAKTRRPPATETRLFFTAKLQFRAADSALPMRPASPENFRTSRRPERIRTEPADTECPNTPRQYDAPLNQRNPIRARRKINAAVETPSEEFFVGFRGGRHRAGAILPRFSLKKNEKRGAYSEEDISRDSSSRAGSETREISESSIRDFSAFAIALRASEMRAEMPSPSRDCANPSMRSAA